MSCDQHQFAPLTVRLLGEQVDLLARIRLLRAQSLAPSLELVTQAAGWEQLFAFIERIVSNQTPTLVYGDYDVDGSTSVFMLHRALRALGVPGNTFLPSRFHHGYGLDVGVIKQAAEQGYKALIALDCGTANLAEIAEAKEAGLDVAVIDHHQPKTELPAAVVLNPHLAAEMPPFCTAGLVYYVLAGLREAGQPIPHYGDELELAGLATLADIVPLEPHNWWLAHQALLRLPETVNHGVGELLKLARLHGISRLTSRDVGFGLGPRLNAPGRMHSAKLVLDLLAAPDTAMARTAAQRIEQLNQDRKQVSETIWRQALLQATEFTAQAGLVLHGQDWHPGVLGIVAARVAEHIGKPTIILTSAVQTAATSETDPVLTGSVRSAGGVDIVEALAQTQDHLISFGGHAAAAGLKLHHSQLAELRDTWHTAIQGAHVTADATQMITRELVNLTELTEDFERDLWELAPFGVGFPPAQFQLQGCHVARSSLMGKDKTHLNLLVTDGSRQVRIAGFNMSHLYNELSVGTPVTPIIEISPDNYNNRLSIALRLVALEDES